LDAALPFLSGVFARKKPSTSDRGLALRCAAQRCALDRSRPRPSRVTVLPTPRTHTHDLAGLQYRNCAPVHRCSLRLAREGRAVRLPATRQACCSRYRWWPVRHRRPLCRRVLQRSTNTGAMVTIVFAARQMSNCASVLAITSAAGNEVPGCGRGPRGLP